jgi:hypothetical protein
MSKDYDIAEVYPPVKKPVANLVGVVERDEEGWVWYLHSKKYG